MSAETYNGWTNRETWAVSLHLNNDEYLYNLATETVQLTEPIGPYSRANRLEEVIADLRDVNREIDDSGTGQGSSEIRMMDREVGSWWRVDWAEVAASFAEEAS